MEMVAKLYDRYQVQVPGTFPNNVKKKERVLKIAYRYQVQVPGTSTWYRTQVPKLRLRGAAEGLGGQTSALHENIDG